MADKKPSRFVRTLSDRNVWGTAQTEIWVDTQTGVNYLYHAAGYGAGLTPLLNRDGSPVVTPVPHDGE